MGGHGGAGCLEEPITYAAVICSDSVWAVRVSWWDERMVGGAGAVAMVGLTSVSSWSRSFSAVDTASNKA